MTMSDTLFDYARSRDEEVLYLLRAIAEHYGIIPYNERNRRRHVDPTWDGCVSEDPHAAVEAVAAPWSEPESVVAPAEEFVQEKTRRRRMCWSRLDARIRELEKLRTAARRRGRDIRTSSLRDASKAEEKHYKSEAQKRRKRLENLLAEGKIEIVDGVLYDLRTGVRTPWIPSSF
jgi:hypothetical protein